MVLSFAPQIGKLILRRLEDTFRALQAGGLTLKPSKVQFSSKDVEYLGQVFAPDGIRIGEDRIKAIVDLPMPTKVRELRSVLGMVNFVRKFIPNLATVIKPLTALTSKEGAKTKQKI